MSENRTPAASEENPRQDPKLPKTFEPSHFEERWYRLWEEEGRFQPSVPPARRGSSWSFRLPNVTGQLHIGHAYGRTIEDILARWMRMRGYRVLWVPGTDHAGIATQMVMERQLAKQGIDRRDLGREKFIERVWAWKREAKDTIQSQLRKLGCSLDWSRERFTLDPDLSRAVRRAFVQLYREGLIYRGRYVVNWCPRCGTAVSDLEVVHREEKGTLYRIRYDVSGVPSGRGRRDDAARDDAGRHRARDPPGGPPHGEAPRQDGRSADRRAGASRHRGRDPRGPGIRHRYREGDPRARRQRFRGRASGTAFPRSSSSVRTGR